MQPSDLNSKPHGFPSHRKLKYCTIGACLWPPPDSVHHTLIFLDTFHGPTHRQKMQGMSQTQNIELYNVLYKYLTGKVYHMLSIYHAGKTHQVPHTTDFGFMIKDLSFLHLVHTTTYNSMNGKQPHFSPIFYVRVRPYFPYSYTSTQQPA